MGFHSALLLYVVVLSRSVVSNSLWFHGLQPARLLWPLEFSRQEYQSGVSCSAAGDLPNPGIQLGSPALQADSLPAEPSGSPISGLHGLILICPVGWLLIAITLNCPLSLCKVILTCMHFPEVETWLKALIVLVKQIPTYLHGQMVCNFASFKNATQPINWCLENVSLKDNNV